MVHEKTAEPVIFAPNKQQIENARKALNETEDKLKHNEAHIKEWLKYQDHLPKNIEECYIRSFLRGCKHNLEKTKRKLENHLIARSLYPEVYSRRSPFSKDIVQIMDVLNIVALPKPTEKGEYMVLFKLEDADINKYDQIAAARLFFMGYEFFMTYDTLSCGHIAIFDCENFSASHYVKFAGPFLKTLMVLLREAYAIRVKQFHILNAPPMLETFLAIVKPLMHPKIRNSFVIHKDKNICSEGYFSPEIMPSNYGGKLRSIRELALSCYDVLNANAEWFHKQEDVMKVTGPIPKKLVYTPYFKDDWGVEGSFRQLNID